MTFAENLKQLRTGRRLSQNDLAVLLHVAPQTVSRWEKGRAEPDFRTLGTLADCFGITIDELLGREPPIDAAHAELLRDLFKRAKEGDVEAAEACLLALSKEIGVRDCEISRYFECAMIMKRNGRLSEDGMMQVRRNIREALLPRSNERRIRAVLPVYIREEERHLGYWNDLIFFPGLSFQPELERSAAAEEPEEFRKKKENCLYNALRETIGLLFRESSNGAFMHGEVNSMERIGPSSLAPCRSALALIDAFSTNEEDVFLDLRIRAEFLCAIALAKEGKDGECLAVCRDFRRHVKALAARKGKTRTGSVPVLAQVRADTEERSVYDLFGELVIELHTIAEAPDAPAVTRDPCFLTEEEIDALLKTPDPGEVEKEFRDLQLRAEKAVKNASPEDYVRAVSVLTENGKIYDFVVSENGSPLSLERKLLDALSLLKERKDTAIRKAAVASVPYQGTGFVYEPLFKLDPRNADTLVLQKERERFCVHRVGAEIARRTARKK